MRHADLEFAQSLAGTFDYPISTLDDRAAKMGKTLNALSRVACAERPEIVQPCSCCVTRFGPTASGFHETIPIILA